MRRCSCCYHRGHRVFHSCGRIALAHGRSRRGRAGGQASRLWSRWRGAHVVGQRLAFRDCLLRRFRFRAVLPACFGRNHSVRRNTAQAIPPLNKFFVGLTAPRLIRRTISVIAACLVPAALYVTVADGLGFTLRFGGGLATSGAASAGGLSNRRVASILSLPSTTERR